MIVYQTDRHGFYVGQTMADPSPLEPGVWLIPGGCVTEVPPGFDPETQFARWVNGAWTVQDIPEPEPEPEPSDPAEQPLRPLTPRQFWLAALALGIIEDQVDALIETYPEPQRSIARIEKKHATLYDRNHQFVLAIIAALLPEKTSEEIDATWRTYQTI